MRGEARLRLHLADYIGETTSYDNKLMLERKDPTSWLKSVSAFANTQGGRLLFGVANDDTLAGLVDAQSDSEFISETIKMQMDPVPEIDLSIHEEDGKRFVVVEIKAGSETPYYTFVKGHRDYLELGSEVHVDIYDDRMEITSPGGMPSGHCVQELDARRVTSKRRNPVIADLFQRLDLMERRGSGFKKILDAYAFESEKRGEIVVPRFESTRTDFFLILPNLNYGRKINGVESSSEHFEHDTVNGIVNDTADGTQNLPVNPPVNPPGREVRATLTKSARAVLAALESDSSMTYDTLAAKLKLHRDTIRVSIASLVRMKLLRRVGPDKTGHWEVVK